MDARGHGDSSRGTGARPYAWHEFGADLAAVARTLAKQHGRVALGLGHSFGGTSMVLAAAEEPELFVNWVPRAFDLYLCEAMVDRADGQVELKCAPETEAAVYAEGGLSDVWG